MRVRIICLIVLAVTQTACNPTWTKNGQPNDASMPVPPDATPPRQAGAAETPQTTTPQR